MSFLLKPLAFLLFILLGCVMMYKGVFHEGDQHVVSKIVMNLTLPAAAIQAFGNASPDKSLVLLVLLGLLCGLVPMLIVFLCSRRMEKARRVFFMLNNSGANLGCFTMPIVQNFFGPAGAVVLCIYDIGNAIISVGGNYTLTSLLLHTDTEGDPSGVRALLKKFFGSPCLDVYLILLGMMLLNIPVPGVVMTITEPLGVANPFLAMFMLGMMFRPQYYKKYLGEGFRLVLLRLGFAAAAALLMFNLTPFPLEVRRVLMLLPFAPATVLAAIFTEKCHGDPSLSSFANSMTVIVSLVVISGLSFWMVA